MIEKHHVHKKDAPSGTAISIAKTLYSENYKNYIPITSVREGDIFGEHELQLENKNEIIKIEHIAKNRDIFAQGTIKYIDWVCKQPNGLYYGIEKKEIKFSKYSGWK